MMTRPGSGYGRPTRPAPPALWREPAVVGQTRADDTEELWRALREWDAGVSA
jgi:hypothetical protein